MGASDPAPPGRPVAPPESSRAARSDVEIAARSGAGPSPRVQAVEPAQLGDHRGQGLAVDELHGVVVHAALAADGVDRDDVRVVQAGGGLGLDLEPLELPGVERRGERQDLQRHAAAERDLLGLVDDPHAAAADLAEDAEVAQDAQLVEGSGAPGRPGGRPVRWRSPSSAIISSAGSSRRSSLGVLGVAGQVPVQVHRVAGLEPVGELVDQVLQDRVEPS